MTVLQTIFAVEIFAVAAVAYLVILFACCTCVVLEQQSLVRHDRNEELENEDSEEDLTWEHIEDAPPEYIDDTPPEYLSY